LLYSWPAILEIDNRPFQLPFGNKKAPENLGAGCSVSSILIFRRKKGALLILFIAVI
jgi:hypothetical protein